MMDYDELIDTVRDSTLTPAEQIQLWKDTAEPDHSPAAVSIVR